MGKSLYFLIYEIRGNRAMLVLREPTLDSRDFIRIRGVRANKMFKNIVSVLDSYALKYSVSKEDSKVIIDLPADVGYAVLLYLLLAYNTREPEKYISFLENLLAGKVPLSNYLGLFVNMAVDLSDLKSRGARRRTAIIDTAAKIISSIMLTLIRSL